MMCRVPVLLLLWLSIFISECRGARTLQQSIKPPPTQPTPTTSMMSLSPVPLTIIQEQATVPSLPICADAIDITNPLGRLRSAMRSAQYVPKNSILDAFIIFYSDEHLSEEPLKPERRLEYISGWDGPGTGAVLADGGAALWIPTTDVNRAKDTVSCAWLVLDADDPSQPTIAEWISDRVARASKVGADARLTSVGEWHSLSTALQRRTIQFLANPTLVDKLWSEETEPARIRPEFPKTVAMNYNIEFAGQSWRDKVTAVRDELREADVSAMVVTALDEVAWLLNVRGRDLPYAPLLKAFIIITMRDIQLFVPSGKLSLQVRDSLAITLNPCNSSNCTRKAEYAAIYNELHWSLEPKILVPSGGTFQRGASAAIAQAVPPAKRVFLASPIIYLKAQKNEQEIKGMRKAHLRDAVAMCTLLSYLENKPNLSEMSVALTVDITRETQEGYVGPAMKTRVAYGPNTADPEYRPTNSTNRRIFKNATMVIQSGGQYQEGTTIVTRTIHYGNPTTENRRAYTTVMRAQAALAALRAPGTLPATHADPVLRAPLWAARQDYPHPTGHGVGAALSRKEDPVVIDYRQDTNLYTLREGYFILIEPGWYEQGKYGIRLGNIFEIVSRPNGYLGFSEATLIPYEPKLIDKQMLTEYEIKWLNDYNSRIRKVVGPELKDRGQTDVYYWMMNKTVSIELPSKARRLTSRATTARQFISVIILLAIEICVLM